jgi:hypothetical protein
VLLFSTTGHSKHVPLLLLLWSQRRKYNINTNCLSPFSEACLQRGSRCNSVTASRKESQLLTNFLQLPSYTTTTLASSSTLLIMLQHQLLPRWRRRQRRQQRLPYRPRPLRTMLKGLSRAASSSDDEDGGDDDNSHGETEKEAAKKKEEGKDFRGQLLLLLRKKKKKKFKKKKKASAEGRRRKMGGMSLALIGEMLLSEAARPRKHGQRGRGEKLTASKKRS